MPYGTDDSLVEVPCNDDRAAFFPLRDPVQQQVRALLHRYCPNMIEMSIEMDEPRSRQLILKSNPRSYARAGGVPAEPARHLRRLGEPKCSVLKGLEAALAVEDYAVLPHIGSIVSALAYPAEIRQHSFQIGDLMTKRFLHADRIRAVEADHAGDHIRPAAPSLLPIFYVIATISNVKRHASQ